MAKVRCSCGAKYSFDDQLTGRRARCKKCGAVFEIRQTGEDLGPLPVADGLDLGAEAEAAAARATERQGMLGPGETRFEPRDADRFADVASPVLPVPGQGRRYLKDLGWSLLFPTDPSNLATLVILCILLSVELFLDFAGCLGLIGLFVIEGWLAAFSLKIVLSAANGEEDLPALTLMEGFIDGIVVPFFKYLAARLVVIAPAVIFLSILASNARTGPGISLADYLIGALAYGDVTGLKSVLFQGGQIAVFTLLLAGGLFMWPIVLMVVAIGGLGSIVRIDLMIATIVRTLSAYLCCVAVVWGCMAVAVGVPVVASILMGTTTTLGVGPIDFLAAGLRAYTQIVAMRAIGLHYHHLKERYAWDWG